ncbi:MAG: hypothetical protein RIR25_659 [Verrucomicrobiota bacterium]
MVSTVFNTVSALTPPWPACGCSALHALHRAVEGHALQRLAVPQHELLCVIQQLHVLGAMRHRHSGWPAEDARVVLREQPHRHEVLRSVIPQALRKLHLGAPKTRVAQLLLDDSLLARPTVLEALGMCEPPPTDGRTGRRIARRLTGGSRAAGGRIIGRLFARPDQRVQSVADQLVAHVPTREHHVAEPPWRSHRTPRR